MGTGGTGGSGTVTATYDSAMPTATAPTLAGYTFSGYYSGADGTGDIYYNADMSSAADWDITSSTTLYAYWVVIDYSVIYDGNGNTGGIVPSDSAVYNVDNIVTVASGEPIKTGYTFNGWVSTAFTGTKSDGGTFTMPASNVTLTAQWTINTHNVYYDKNTGLGVQTDNANPYDYNEQVTVLDEGTITKTGYAFSGWNTTAGGNGTVYASGATFNMPDNDMTLFAQWTVVDYSVKYKGNGSDGGTVPTDSTDYNYQDTVKIKSSEPTRTGYAFDGWTSAAFAGVKIGGDTFSMPDGEVILTAKWTADLQLVRYIKPDGSVATEYHYTDESFYLSDGTGFIKDGYRLTGWKIDGVLYELGAEYTTPPYNPEINPVWTEDIQWITYSASGSNFSVSVEHQASKVIVLHNGEGFAREGYVIEGWEIDGKVYMLGELYLIPAHSVTVSAVWAADSDNDGFSDVDEIAAGSDPNNILETTADWQYYYFCAGC